MLEKTFHLSVAVLQICYLFPLHSPFARSPSFLQHDSFPFERENAAWVSLSERICANMFCAPELSEIMHERHLWMIQLLFSRNRSAKTKYVAENSPIRFSPPNRDKSPPYFLRQSSSRTTTTEVPLECIVSLEDVAASSFEFQAVFDFMVWKRVFFLS